MHSDIRADIQKATFWKRFAAWLLDFILLAVLATGVMYLASIILGCDRYIDQVNDAYSHYEEAYGISFEVKQEEYEAFTDEQRQNWDDAYQALINDDDAMYAYNMMVNLILVMATAGILIAMLILHFVIPLILKNGQTIGKKIFGIAVMRTNSVQIGAVSLFTRALLGKYTLETMIPVLVVLMLMFNVTGLMGTLLVLAIGIAQVVMLCVTKTNSLIHDKLADTVVVDLASQMIFATEEDLLDYKKRMSADNAAQASYF